ncbi:hypothetical protein [Gloeobacter kilaueensis]|uniref:hypothetical protein n=1 Tax=Gloeobacter kilaueensis TaxID=1416614 RepID=UPI001FE0C87B|nr:hypothetical protein [Gloeobacter kilaueensis]
MRASQLATAQAVQVTNQNLDRLTSISGRFITVVSDAIAEFRATTNWLDRAIEELRVSNEESRASNRRQEAINDYLLRQERRDNDDES